MLPKVTAGEAWLALGTSVLVYDLLAPAGETLSEGVDRALEHPIYKYLCVGLIGATALHLCNALPNKYDPFHQVLSLVK